MKFRFPGMVVFLTALWCLVHHGFAFQQLSHRTRSFVQHFPGRLTTLHLASEDDEGAENSEGAELAAQFFKAIQNKGIDLSADDIDEDEEDDEDEDEDEPNIPQGAINAFLGYDTGNVGDKLAGNVSLTDSQLYSEVRERVLDTAGGFVDFVRKANEDDDEEEEDSDEPKIYVPPTQVPDPDLTAGEVVGLVLEALSNNDVPTPNRGVEILFGYSSPGSQIMMEEGLTPDEYAGYLLEDPEYQVLFENWGFVVEKGDYSFEGKKAFFNARLQTGPDQLDTVSVNFILSPSGGDESSWLIDSMLIRPQSMRRRRRR